MNRIHALASLIVLLTFVLPFGAEERGGDPLPAPDGWRSEEMEMPPPFAPSLAYEGRLHVKFSPTWRHFEATDGWTYAFVWRVAPAEVDAERLESDLETYFTGLMKAVGAERFPGKEVPTVANLRSAEPESPWTQKWLGTVRTWNPFADGEPVELHFEIRDMRCQGGERQALLFLVSKAPPTEPVWRTLRGLVPGARC